MTPLVYTRTKTMIIVMRYMAIYPAYGSIRCIWHYTENPMITSTSWHRNALHIAGRLCGGFPHEGSVMRGVNVFIVNRENLWIYINCRVAVIRDTMTLMWRICYGRKYDESWNPFAHLSFCDMCLTILVIAIADKQLFHCFVDHSL